jgi:hypothetical protein
VHPASGVVVIALSGVCHGPEGCWALNTLAAHPGGFARTAITPTADPDPRRFGVRAERVLRGDATALAVDMGADASLEITLRDAVPWPARAFGALGIAHAIPSLPQYWHPVVLAAGVRGHVRAGDIDLDLDGGVGYAEKNWGHGFPGRWWWGHAATFGDDVSVSFAGGRMALPGGAVAPTAVVVRLGGRVIALAPPLATTQAALGAGAWRLRTRGRGYRVEIEGAAGDERAHELLVPVPGQLRGELRSQQQLAGSLALRVRRGRRLLYDGRSALAGLEVELPVNRAPHAAPRA